MHHGMQYDSILGQGQGHKPLTVGNSAIFKGYLLLFLSVTFNLWSFSRKSGKTPGCVKHVRSVRACVGLDFTAASRLSSTSFRFRYAVA